MKNFFALTVVLCLGLAFFVSPLLAQTAPSPDAQAATDAAEEETQVASYTSIRKISDSITLGTLENGLTVIVQENHVAPVATVRCTVRNTGSVFEGKYLGAGLSHVLEHIVSGGQTTKRSEAEIENMIDRFGGVTNAFTSKDRTAYFIDCPADKAMTAIELIADSMIRCALNEDELNRELAVVERELRDGEVNRQRVKWNVLHQTIYAQHPVRHPIIGYIDLMKGIDSDAIRDFYKTRYIPNNMVFVVVGDVDTEKVLDQIARQMGSAPRGLENFLSLEDEPPQITPRRVVREMEGETFDVVISWPTVRLTDPDLYALDVASYILSQGESSRLSRRLKYDEPLVMSVDTASYTPHYLNGFFAVMYSAQADTWEKAEKIAIEEVYRLRDELVPEDQLAKAKKQKATEQIFRSETVQEAADSLTSGFLGAADPQFDLRYVEGIQKVTPEDVQRVARKYFVPERLNTIIIAPEGTAAEAAETDKQDTSGDTQLMTLDNGVRLLLKRHTNLPMVNIQAFVLAGTLVDTPETAGRSTLLAGMLDKGTETRSAQEIADYFDSIGGRFSVNAGRFTIYASATVLADDFNDTFDLFADCFTGSTIPADEMEKVKTRMLGAIAARSGNPHAEIMDTFYGALPESTPFHVLTGGTKESVEPMTAEGLREFYGKYFVPQNMIVTVFGDIDPEEAKKLVEKSFGTLEPAKDFTPPTFKRDNALAESIVRHKLITKPTGMVLLGYPECSIFDKSDYASLTVLDAVMSGYGYPGGWLHAELRGAGLVYFVHAFQVTGPVPGYFSFLAQTAPDKTAEVAQRIRSNIERAKSGEISKDEFETAIDQITAAHAQENTTIASQARQAALDEIYGLGFQYDRTFDERIKAVTLEDVVAVANKYFGNSVEVVASPIPPETTTEEAPADTEEESTEAVVE